MHEYNHCWQGYGFGVGGEVTNNATTLVSYSLYTRISQGRTLAPNGGLGGWNRFTDPAKALGELLNNREGNNGTQQCFDLSVYATLLHNIGQDNFLEAAHGGRENSTTIYYNNLVEATHQDMTWFADELLNYNVVDTTTHSNGVLQKASVDAVKAKNYPMFVPVASVYQVGRGISCDGKTDYITTAQPYSYGTGEYVMDFTNKNNFKNGSFVSKELVIPDGFTATVKSVTQPENGAVELLSGNKVKYTPATGDKGLCSGNFKVKLAITKNDNAFKVEDVDLVINLKQNSSLLRTTYVYDGTAPATDSLLNASTKTVDISGYSSTETKKNVCAMETNTQIWQSGWNYDDDSYVSNSTNYRVMPLQKTLQTLEGVMYLPTAGSYRFTLKGRGEATLYLSYDNGTTWEKGLTIKRLTQKGNTDYKPGEYTQHEFTSDKSYVHFKVVHKVYLENNFFGVGIASKDESGNFGEFKNATAYLNTDLHKMISADEAKKFTTEYRYKNEYKYTYTTDATYGLGSLVSVSHDPWDDSLKIDNLFDGKANTYYHSKNKVIITQDKPFELVADLGGVKKVNQVTFNGFKNKINNNGMPVTFKLYGSVDNSDYKLLTEQTDMTADKRVITLDFDQADIRYYKLVVTRTDNNAYFAMNSIVFSYKGVTFENGKHIAPNDASIGYKGEWGFENALCNFGTLYTGVKDDSVEFKFNGTRFAYFAYQSSAYGTVDIYVDGKPVASDVSLSADKNVGALAYMHEDALTAGEHTVKVVGKSGKFNVDSFAYWE